MSQTVILLNAHSCKQNLDASMFSQEIVSEDVLKTVR